jgi:hypothetical protein
MVGIERHRQKAVTTELTAFYEICYDSFQGCHYGLEAQTPGHLEAIAC